jgi:hypothetical protein
MFPKRSLENILFLLCFLLRSSVTTGDLIVIVLFIIIIIIIILPHFCDRDFSELAGSIFIICGRVIGHNMNLIHFLAFSKYHFRSGDIVDFLFSKTNFVREWSPKRLKIIYWNFQGL